MKPTVILVAGLGFGDEGKGSVTDFLCRTETGVKAVVRYNGGAQAGHNVVTPFGAHHTFAQFGSGTFAGVPTFLSRFMLVNPFFLQNEAEGLRRHGFSNPYEYVFVDRDALITNPFQVAANRLREFERGDKRHGSCGMGIGETVSDALRFPDMAIHIRDLNDPASLRRKLLFSRDAKLSELTDAIERARADYRQNALDHKEWQRLELFKDDGLIDEFVDRYSRFVQDTNIVDRTLLRSLLSSGVTLFEGAQGVLLDEDYGFHPHTTWSKTTFQNADALLAEAGFTGQVKRLGLLRAYMTRHGAGPLPTEVDVPNFLTDVHNGYGTFQEGFRLGHFDFVLAQYALKAIGGVDELVLTNLDKLRSQQPKICTRYEVSESSILPTVTELPFMTGPDLKFQEGLTKLLFKSRPVYETLADRPSIISRISWTLKTPVTLCSFGPTCERKFPTHCYHIQEATWDS